MGDREARLVIGPQKKAPRLVTHPPKKDAPKKEEDLSPKKDLPGEPAKSELNVKATEEEPTEVSREKKAICGTLFERYQV